MLLELSNVSVGYAGAPVAREVSFTLQGGEIACLLGPSGTGKTTLLRAIAGFEPVSQGSIRAGGRLLADPQHGVPPEQRGLGMLFQDFALLPHLSALENVALALFHLGRAQRRERALGLLQQVGLADAAARYPHELSGGMQQRVALARALANEPRLLLLDEPFSSLDAELREKLSLEVRALLKRNGTTALMVTHAQTEAFAMADRIGVMRDGRLLQWATPYDLYHRPASREVANFIGERTWLRGRVVADGSIETTLAPLPRKPNGLPPGTPVDVLLRPDDVLHDDASPQTATVMARSFRGSDFLYTLQLDDGTQVLSLVPSHHDHAVGQRIGIRAELEHVVVFPAG